MPGDELLERLPHPQVRAPVHHLVHRCLLFHTIEGSDDMFWHWFWGWNCIGQRVPRANELVKWCRRLLTQVRLREAISGQLVELVGDAELEHEALVGPVNRQLSCSLWNGRS